MVVEGSVQRADDSLEVSFQLTDYQASVSVIYTGILPDLFDEGQGAVASIGAAGSRDRAALSEADATRRWLRSSWRAARTRAWIRAWT